MHPRLTRQFCLGASCAALLGTQAVGQVDLAVYNAAQHDANGFTFDDFSAPGAFSTAGGLLNIDIATDFAAGNGLFGGAGSDITASAFAAADAVLEVTLEVDPLNAATDFRVVLGDSDDAFSGDEFQFFFDLTGVTPGTGLVTLSQPLLVPGPVFVQPQFGKLQGDEIQNYDGGVDTGLTQIQIQSAFGATDRLKINVESVKIVDPGGVPDPTLIELTTATFASAAQSFDFGTFQDPGALDVSGENIIINANSTNGPEMNGGLGFNGLAVDFDTADYQIEVEAKLLSGNTADSFNILLGDLDGDDSGPGLGSEDYLFAVDTADLNETDFTTVVIPLGSGSESSIETTFGFTNGGDGLQNFDLSQLQLQSDENDLGFLALEVARVSIVEKLIAEFIDGDYNGDGFVSQADLDLVLLNWGDSAVPAEWLATDQFDGVQVSQNELDGVLLNWGNGTPPAGVNAIPEPASALLVGLGGLAALRRRTHRA